MVFEESVLHLHTGTRRTVYVQSGNQGQQWLFGRVSLIIDRDYQMQFEATKGNGPDSFVAIDDITISNTPCSE